MSQFIEMFGTIDKPKFTLNNLGNLCDIQRGGSPRPIKDYITDDADGLNWIKIGDTDDSMYIVKTAEKIKPSGLKKTRQVYAGDLLLSNSMSFGRPYILKIDGCIHDGWLVLHIKDKSKLTQIYLCAFLSQKSSYYEMSKLAAGGVVQNLNSEIVKKLPVILPPMEKQFEYISILQQSDKSGFVSLKSQFIEMFGNPLASIQKYPLKKLGECCKLNPRRPSLDLEDTDKVSFVPMPSVSENGYLQDVIDEEYGKVKKGFTYFKNNDVLFAKITPCMENGKGAIAEGLTNNIGMGSTEFHVLRPIEGKSNPFWLLALTRLPIFRERATKNMSGTGGQKRVPATYLENFMVGLPPIEEQNRFENIFNQADKSGYGYGFKLAS